MDGVVRVKDWDGKFENNRSRTIKNLGWLSFPGAFNYEWLWLAADEAGTGTDCVAAWLAMLMLASQTPAYERRRHGLLMRTLTEAFTPESMSIVSRLPAEAFKRAIPRLCEIGWIETVSLDEAIRILGGGRKQASVDDGADAVVMTCTLGEGAKRVAPGSSPPRTDEVDVESLATPDGPLDAAVRKLRGKPLSMIAPTARAKINAAIDDTSEAAVIAALNEAAEASDSKLRTIQAACTSARLGSSGAAFAAKRDAEKNRPQETIAEF